MKTGSYITDFENVVLDVGVPVTIINYSYRTYSGTEYDDEYTVKASGTSINTFGIVQPLGQKPFSSDFVYLQQGKIGINDCKMYICGSIPITAEARITLNNGSIFAVAGEGILSFPETTGSPLNYPVYKKVYLTYMQGSGGYV